MSSSISPLCFFISPSDKFITSKERLFRQIPNVFGQSHQLFRQLQIKFRHPKKIEGSEQKSASFQYYAVTVSRAFTTFFANSTTRAE